MPRCNRQEEREESKDADSAPAPTPHTREFLGLLSTQSVGQASGREGRKEEAWSHNQDASSAPSQGDTGSCSHHQGGRGHRWRGRWDPGTSYSRHLGPSTSRYFHQPCLLGGQVPEGATPSTGQRERICGDVRHCPPTQPGWEPTPSQAASLLEVGQTLLPALGLVAGWSRTDGPRVLPVNCSVLNPTASSSPPGLPPRRTTPLPWCPPAILSRGHSCHPWPLR